MNVLAISPDLVLAMLQGQNIKRDIAKKVEIKNVDSIEEEKEIKQKEKQINIFI